MSFSRAELLNPDPDHTKLTKSMIGIEMNFADEGDFQADIEETLLCKCPDCYIIKTE